MGKRKTLIIGLTRADAELELAKEKHFHSEVRGRNTKFYKKELVVETETILIKAVGERSLAMLDGYGCNEFVLTPHLLNSKSTDELIKIIDLCKTMTIKHKR